MRPILLRLVIVMSCFGMLEVAINAAEPQRVLDVWPDLAPGETTKLKGVALPRRENETPPVTRVIDITFPTLDVFEPSKEQKNGTAVLILPGGGFYKVVPDMEGSEAATWLNALGVTAFVLRYRTTEKGGATPWKRPHQDAQRAMRLIRAKADQWGLDKNRIGLLAFSAGGQVGAILETNFAQPAYERVDQHDEHACRPDFAMLIYPWNVLNSKTGKLMKEIRINDAAPPTFLVHAHDDNSTSLGSLAIYAGLKQHGVSAELHVYQSGGHGYGLRRRPNSDIHTWPQRAADWLRVRKLVSGTE